MKIRKKLPKPLEAVFGFIELLFSTLLAVSLVFTYLLRIVEVSGDSMSDTLETGDKVIMTAFCNNPKQGDIVVFYASDAVTLDENGRLVPRENYRISALNCGDEDFAIACMRANLRYLGTSCRGVRQSR